MLKDWLTLRVEGHGVGTKGERCLPSPGVRPRSRKLKGAAPFTSEYLGPVTFLGLKRFASDPLVELLGWSLGGLLSMELGARFGLLKQLTWRHSPLPTGNSKRILQTSAIASATAMTRKKRLCMPYTTVSRFTRFGVTPRSGRPSSNPNSSCCSTLVTSWTMLTLRIEMRSVWCFSRS